MNTNKYGFCRIFLGVLCGLLFIFPACAQNKITASITVTNLTTNGMVFTYNGSTRTFTTNVSSPSTQVLTNSDVTGCGSKTNLLTQLRSTPFAQTTTADTGSNSFNIVGNADLAVALTVSAGYASISYSTQTVTTVYVAQVPVSSLPTAVARTNVASGIVASIGAQENTNSIPYNSKAASELVGTNGTQTIPGQKTLSNTNNQISGIISSLAISGNSVKLTNGLYYTPIFIGPVMTNGVNYGDFGFSSPGSSPASEQFGNLAQATGTNSSAFGTEAYAPGNYSISLGASANALGPSSSAVGLSANASKDSSTAIGAGTAATGTNATAAGAYSWASSFASSAFGYRATSLFTNSTAIGANASNTAPNQVMLGAPGSDVVVPNTLSVGGAETITGGAVISGGVTITGGVNISGPQTNGAYFGTNNFLANSDIAFTRKAVSSLAAGGNAAVPVGTNVFFEVAGPGAAFSIDGIANGRDGKLVILLNQTSQQMTINNESGTDPTAANRIRTLGSAGNLVLTNAACTFIYSGAASRWMLISHNP